MLKFITHSSYALSRNDVFDIKLIITTTFNVTGRAQLLAKYLYTTNRIDVDIGIGIPSNFTSDEIDGVGPQMVWALDYNLNNYPGNIYNNGIQKAIEIISTQGSTSMPIYYLSLGAMSSLSDIISKNPELKRKMRLIQMAGSIYKGYGTNHPQQEYNVNSNGTAARIIYNHTDSIRFVNDICSSPLDTTYYFQIYGDNYQIILNSTEIIPKTLIENYQVWYDNGGKDFGAYRPFSPQIGTSTMYNAQAVWMASIIAMNSTQNKQYECDMIPFMKMEGNKIIVNDTQYTVIDTYNNDKIQTVYESIAWNEGDENGSYPLGAYIANILANPK